MNGDTLECWYRISRTQRDETYILRKYSADGIHWSERETAIDLQDPAVVRDGPGDMIVSPAIQKIGGRYCMWYVNDIGESRSICRSFSDDGRNWQKKEYCRLSDTAVVPWHIDVQRIDSIYYMVIYDFRNLTLWSSRDGLFFEKRRLLLAPSPKLGSFYAGGLYRSALLRDDKECKLYFSAFDKKTAVGLMRGNCPDSLKIYSVSGNKTISAASSNSPRGRIHRSRGRHPNRSSPRTRSGICTSMYRSCASRGASCSGRSNPSLITIYRSSPSMAYFPGANVSIRATA